jgi:hypothetical protein
MHLADRAPFVSWEDLVSAYQPVAAPTEARLRTLRSNDVVSTGLRFPRRQAGRLAGQLRVFCTLNREAAYLARHHQPELAKLYAKRAESLEASWKARLEAALLPGEELEGLLAPHRASRRVRALLEEFAHETDAARNELPEVEGREELVGVVEMTAQLMRLYVERRSDCRRLYLELPSRLAESYSFRVGDPVEVTQQVEESSVVVWVRPAVAHEAMVDVASFSDRARQLSEGSGDVLESLVTESERDEAPVIRLLA